MYLFKKAPSFCSVFVVVVLFVFFLFQFHLLKRHFCFGPHCSVPAAIFGFGSLLIFCLQEASLDYLFGIALFKFHVEIEYSAFLCFSYSAAFLSLFRLVFVFLGLLCSGSLPLMQVHMKNSNLTSVTTMPSQEASFTTEATIQHININ